MLFPHKTNSLLLLAFHHPIFPIGDSIVHRVQYCPRTASDKCSQRYWRMFDIKCLAVQRIFIGASKVTGHQLIDRDGDATRTSVVALHIIATFVFRGLTVWFLAQLNIQNRRFPIIEVGVLYSQDRFNCARRCGHAKKPFERGKHR